MTPMAKGTLFAVLALCSCLTAAAQQKESSTAVTVSGLVIPRDDDGMYVRNSDGQFEIEWTEKTEVALEVSTRLFKGLEQNVLHYSVHSSPQVIDFPVPKGPVTGIITLRGSTRVDDALKVAREENWIPEFGLVLRYVRRLS